jgi:FAD/FMN-containing dehydrogenase/Fe-S oxidoreductase
MFPDADASVRDAARTALARRLRGKLAGEARFDRLSRAIYSTDASLYEIEPLGVILPRTIDDVRTTVLACGELGVPIVARGAGTGIAGGAVGWGVQIDFSRFMHRIGPIDAEARRVSVQSGAVLDDVNRAAAAAGLHFPPDVATASRATIGGMIGNNSCGSHSVLYGRTVDYVDELMAVLADGRVVTWRHEPFDDLPPLEASRALRFPPPWDRSPVAAADRPLLEALDRVRHEVFDDVLARYPRVMRRNGGYALDRLCLSRRPNPATLLCASEGTLALVVEAKLRLVPLPRCKALLVVAFASVGEALRATPTLLEHKPAAIELVDELILAAGFEQVAADVRAQFLDRVVPAILIFEVYDDDESALRRRLSDAQRAVEAAHAPLSVRSVLDAAVQAAVWTLRNRGFGLLMSRPGDRHPYEFIEDAAVHPTRLADYIGELGAMLAREGVPDVGYYAHASVGVIHVRPVLNLHKRDDVRRLRRIAESAAELVLKYGGALTGEHGDGIVRSEFLERMYGPRIVEAFGRIKRAFDPRGLFNPRKIVDPLPMDRRLRAVCDDEPAASRERVPLVTHFDYGPHGSPAGLARMCSGVGQCRQKTGVMCPSYVATLDERHTTRARAVALRIALEGRGSLDGLSDPALEDVMDLCLSCKACKTECPTGVDMARLKAEWQAQRIEQRGSTLRERFFAHAADAVRAMQKMPRWVDALARSGAARIVLDRVVGLDRRIAPPALAAQSFRQWWESHEPLSRGTAGRVLFFVDTWTDAYTPTAGVACVRLLEALGFEVLAPRLACCGRPLISQGFLKQARDLARENAERLAEWIDRVDWIVGVEPSCVLTFVDEFPHFVREPIAAKIREKTRLADTLIAQALRERPRVFSPSADAGEVLLHAHCHQKALVGTRDTLELVVRAAGGAAREIDSGCCGMAGSFGHDRRHYNVARAIGEQRLLPAVRQRGAAQVVVTGFSCREQITHHTSARPRHALEFLADTWLGPAQAVGCCRE